MVQLFSQGGPLFMGILTLIFLALIIVFVKTMINSTDENVLQGTKWMKSIGSLGLVVGILGQLIGLYSAFSMMETSGSVAPNILAGGLKVSMITTMYGVVIFVFYLIFRMILKAKR